MHVRTPCVGLCSTTFGDLVCRGCKRWAHEITGWNGFESSEKHVVVRRLGRLRTAVVASYLDCADPSRLPALVSAIGLPQLDYTNAEERDAVDLFALLRRDVPLGTLGYVLRPGPLDGLDGRALYLALDREWLARSVAEYEHSTRQRVLLP